MSRSHFLHQFEFLITVLEERRLFDLHNSAVVLRQLLLDEIPLYVLANREHKIKIKFPVGSSVREHAEALPFLLKGSKNNYMGTGDGFAMQVAPLRQVPKDEFLTFPVVCINSRFYSIRDVINACANKLGGAHYQDSSKDLMSDTDFRVMNENFEVGGAPSIFFELKGIIRCVLHGLYPLYISCGGTKELPEGFRAEIIEE